MSLAGTLLLEVLPEGQAGPVAACSAQPPWGKDITNDASCTWGS